MNFKTTALFAALILCASPVCILKVDAREQTLKTKSKKDPQDPCMKVTLTGTMGGPGIFDGLAGPGTLVTFGTEGNGCSDVRLQFDIGRGTTLRLS